MPTPPPWPFAMARLLTAVLFWPAMVCATGAMALVLTFLLAGHATPIGTVALVLSAGAAGRKSSVGVTVAVAAVMALSPAD